MSLSREQEEVLDGRNVSGWKEIDKIRYANHLLEEQKERLLAGLRRRNITTEEEIRNALTYQDSKGVWRQRTNVDATQQLKILNDRAAAAAANVEWTKIFDKHYRIGGSHDGRLKSWDEAKADNSYMEMLADVRSSAESDAINKTFKDAIANLKDQATYGSYVKEAAGRAEREAAKGLKKQLEAKASNLRTDVGLNAALAAIGVGNFDAATPDQLMAALNYIQHHQHEIMVTDNDGKTHPMTAEDAKSIRASVLEYFNIQKTEAEARTNTVAAEVAESTKEAKKLYEVAHARREDAEADISEMSRDVSAALYPGLKKLNHQISDSLLQNNPGGVLRTFMGPSDIGGIGSGFGNFRSMFADFVSDGVKPEVLLAKTMGHNNPRDINLIKTAMGDSSGPTGTQIIGAASAPDTSPKPTVT